MSNIGNTSIYATVEQLLDIQHIPFAIASRSVNRLERLVENRDDALLFSEWRNRESNGENLLCRNVLNRRVSRYVFNLFEILVNSV